MPRPKRNCKSTWKTRGQTRSATRSRGRRSHQIEVSMQPIVEQPAVVQSNATTTNYAAVTQDQGQINQFYHTNQNDYVNTSSVQNQCHYSSHTHVPGVLGQQSLYHSNSVNTSSVQNQGHYSQLANCVVPASVVPVTHTNVPGMLGQQSLYPSNSMQVPYTQHCQGAVPSTASVSEGFASTSQGLQMSPAGGMFESPVVGQPPMVHETSGPPEVWVIGSSIIRDAYYYSIENKGHNLGLDLKIVWDFRSDIDECADWNKSQCNKKGSQCVNYHRGYVCVCHRGWTGTRCENDINECNDTSTCGVKASCTNFDGGYNCTCNKDFPKGDPTFHCYVSDCGSLEMLNISNAANKLLFTDTKYGSSAAVTCITGYYDNNKAQMKGVSSTLIKCSENGTWVTVPKCVRKDCGNLTDIKITNAVHRRLHTDTKFKSIADIDCDDGYYIKGRIQTAGISTQTITCSDTGTWTNVPECISKDCGDVQNVRMEHAANRTLLNGDTKYNDTAEVTCDLGYYDTDHKQTTGVSKRTILCSYTGKWTNTPKCIPKDCGNVAYLDIRNANNRRENNGTEYESTAEIDCDAGFHNKDITQTSAISTTTIKCSDRGTWIDIPTCVPKEKAMPTICFSCDGMSSPEYCDKVEHCQANQICYTESYQTDYGKVFRSGCMDEQQCHREETGTSNSVCVECCTNEMCNNKGCGNSDFPPREHRGPMCFDCQHIGDISSCRKVTMCASDQVCSIEKQQWGDTYHYKLGCTHHLCNSLLHQISGTVSSCHACCRYDYCNKNCTSSSSSPGEILVG